MLAAGGTDWAGLAQVVGALTAFVIGVGGGLAGWWSKRRSASTDEVSSLRAWNVQLMGEIGLERTTRRAEITALRQEYDARLREQAEQYESLLGRYERCESDRAQLRRQLASYGNGG